MRDSEMLPALGMALRMVAYALVDAGMLTVAWRALSEAFGWPAGPGYEGWLVVALAIMSLTHSAAKIVRSVTRGDEMIFEGGRR